MYKIDVYKIREGYGNIEPLNIKRDWMDDTYDAHAYKCFPVTLTNGLGFGISFPEDIVFIWDGISDTSPDHVKILSGEKYAYSGRANATVSFNTGLMFRTDEETSILQMPVPNQFIEGVHPFTTLISTSFFKGEIPCAWRITKPNTEIIIKAGTPIISILPLSLTGINNSEITIKSMLDLPKNYFYDSDYSNIVYELNREGKWSNFYRDAVDHKNNSIGKHEVKSIRLKVIKDKLINGGQNADHNK
jgi:hypothetical protein